MKTNWPIKKLGEVLDYEQPSKYIVASKNYSSDYKTPVLTAGKTFILGNTSEKENIFPADKLPVIIFDDFTTATQFVDFPFKVKSSAMKILHPKKDKADAKYIFYLMQTIKLNHATHKRFWISEYSEIEIPVPPIEEQRKIVARLEKMLAKIKEVKQLRADAQESTQNILSAELHKIFKEGKSKGWQENILGKVCEIVRGGSPRPIKEYITESKDGINWVKISDATASSKYIYETKEKIKKEGLKKTRLVKPGDFILSNSMSFGRPYIMKTTGAIHDGWLLLRPQENLLEEYLYYFLSSDDISNQFRMLAGGAVVQNLNSNLVRSVKVLTPSIEEQKKIVSRLNMLSEKIKELQEYQNHTQEELVNLENSILHKTFAN